MENKEQTNPKTGHSNQEREENLTSVENTEKNEKQPSEESQSPETQSGKKETEPTDSEKTEKSSGPEPTEPEESPVKAKEKPVSEPAKSGPESEKTGQKEETDEYAASVTSQEPESEEKEKTSEKTTSEKKPEPEEKEAPSQEKTQTEAPVDENKQQEEEQKEKEKSPDVETEPKDKPVSDTPDAVAETSEKAADVADKATDSKEVTVSETEEPAKPAEATASPPPSDTEKEKPATEASGKETAREEKPDETGKALETQKEDKKEEEKEEKKEEEKEDAEDLGERYSQMSREELVETLENLVKDEDVNTIRKHIGFIKAAFRKLLKEESLSDYEKSMGQETEQEETAEKLVDPLTERFDAAFGVYKEKKTLFDQELEQRKQENLKIKEDILDELRNLIDSEEELKKTYDHFNDLQERWRQVGPIPQGSKSTLWNNYHFLVEKFFDKVKINKELKDLDLKKNMETKTELCEKAEELLLESSITKSFQRLQKLHEAWKETGPVPKDKKDELWDRFKAATDKLNSRRQEYYDTLREEQNKNYAAKILLCEKAEEIASRQPESPRQWQKNTEEINELFKVWKTIGFAPKKVNNEIWNRFRSALDSFFKSKKEFFKKFKEVQTENYNQKLNLCMQAEAIKDSEDWRRTTEELIELQKQWKKIGPVPAKFSDKIWKRFRSACDDFFNRKSEHFSNIGEKQDENLEKKKALIEKIKTHKYSDDNNENLKILKEFQREWMNIGHVPIKQKDKIQNEFRKAVDEQFEVLKISKKAKSTLSFRTKIENIKNSPQADNIIYKERNFINNKINALQNDINLWENNIGFFASSKKADVLKAEFEEKIEKARQEIAILQEKLKILRNSE